MYKPEGIKIGVSGKNFTYWLTVDPEHLRRRVLESIENVTGLRFEVPALYPKHGELRLGVRDMAEDHYEVAQVSFELADAERVLAACDGNVSQADLFLFDGGNPDKFVVLYGDLIPAINDILRNYLDAPDDSEFATAVYAMAGRFTTLPNDPVVEFEYRPVEGCPAHLLVVVHLPDVPTSFPVGMIVSVNGEDLHARADLFRRGAPRT